ncbi:MAG TPA: UDP-galactopyranose mutase [Limnochordia bacterium]
MKTDYLIVGAGFTGCVMAERIANELGRRVLIVERRNHVGGNAFDEYNEQGVLVHRYGPHIFHTNSRKVWDYLSRFTEWRPYYHRVLGVIDGQKVPIPFNLNSLYALFPLKCAQSLESRLIEAFGFGVKVPILKLRESASGDLRFLADYIYDKVFYGYTLKQWDLTPEQLDPSVTARVPVHISRDDRYFQDRYQAMPLRGYTRLFQRMLDHPRIKVLLNTDYREIADEVKFERLIYTGPIDAFFDYMYGPLPYRSLRFEHRTLDQEVFQEVGTVNYPNDQPYTRITEVKHLTGQRLPKTTLTIEYPEPYVIGSNEPFYPIPLAESRQRFARYRKEAEALNGRVLFAGRLADYQYYNMDQAVARALMLFEKQLCAASDREARGAAADIMEALA